MRGGGNDVRSFERFFYRSDRAVLPSEILGEVLGRIAREFANKFRGIGRTANAKEARCRVVVEQRDQHLVQGSVRERTKEDAALNTVNNFGNDFRFACTGRTPDEVEDGAVN